MLLKEQEKDHPKKPDQECFAPLSVASFLTGLLEEQLAILYQKEKKYEEAERIWEHRIVKRVTDIQTALMNMLELSLIKNHHKNAEFFAGMYEKVTRQFYFPEWMRYNAHLQLALEKRNKDETLNILKKMLPAMKKEWNPQDYQLYHYASDSDSALLSSKLADLICDELVNNEEYAFIRDMAEFRELMKHLKRI